MASDNRNSQEQSFAKSLYFGNILEELVFPFPELSKDEKETVKIFLDGLRQFAKDNIDTAKIDQTELLPKELLQGLGELGLFGASLPSAYGGAGLSMLAYARVFEEVCKFDASIGATLAAHQSIGCKGIVQFGTEAQKKKYLPDCASGKTIAAFCLTEPNAGSDAAGIKTKAILTEDKKHYILNGSKIWITNGGFADLFTVFAKTPVKMPSGEEKMKITAFIVTRDMGVTSGEPEHKLGIRGSSTTEVFFKDIKVPAENVLGEIGKGFKVAMEILNSGRLGLAAGCLGGAKHALQLAQNHATNRIAFRRPIAEFGLIQDKIATMMMEIYGIECVTYMTAGLVDKGVKDYSIESAICKIVSSEYAWHTVDEAVQTAAGAAYMRDYPYEQLMRDCRINMIYEGTSEILRCFIALSGMQGPGNYLKEVGTSLKYPLKGIGPLYEYAVTKISRDVIGWGDHITKADPHLKKEASFIEDYTKQLPATIEKVLSKYRQEIWEKEFIQKRIANIVIDLFTMVCTVSRTTSLIQNDGLNKSQQAVDLCQAFCERAHRRIKRNFRAMDNNDDERLIEIATQTYKSNGYPYDIL